MFKLEFTGPASVPTWHLQFNETYSIVIDTPSNKLQGIYSDFVRIAECLPEIFAELSSGNSQIFGQLAPRMVELMGAKSFVFQLLKARGWDVVEHSASYATFKHIDVKKFSGAFIDGCFIWHLQSASFIGPGAIRTHGGEVFFKTTEEDFDSKYLTVINS